MSEVKSKVPGVVDEVKAAVGDKIEKGQPIVILEAMKMPVASPEAGVLKSLAVNAGDRVNPGMVLFEIAAE
ncbi:acetyl-CoA carboxylase biotin carboxyl carrier protein subunit [Klebsiella pneumoniae]|uniref:acetyl-CoA carboxylase biotin carboxyl carrier protein subunit n=1 Tax=Klebsiella pneumoniae TaxID=573 RepID=UPI0006275BFB|nr:acetyl-CoA carboxylase biotin carboxyl carrier protein subunit [Klebsiella pneumoniae]KKJ12557.1 biotin [Klebsiella pneumoniae HE12]MCC4982955.1 acetyl-CoA carboxylase biotin carboxyl carrier protein subunit [Klebsiella pneumoniae]HBY6014983.1 acetyl-CoA carboxylase biotin carboxyl carrier protein subunit [Klebsiella pneumoniae]HBY6073660.1 acetyl-CoA carboxylase biotin carboxyl carrier protein subunit [Klebsiella pneumoniae]